MLFNWKYTLGIPMPQSNPKNNLSSFFMLCKAPVKQRKAMADEIQRSAKCRAICFQQAREAFKGQLSDDQVIMQIANDIYKEVFLEQATIAKLEEMGKAIESLQTENQTENQEIKKRLTYLEYDLHAENKHLRDENFGRRQEVDYASEDYSSNEDSCEREYSEERRGR